MSFSCGFSALLRSSGQVQQEPVLARLTSHRVKALMLLDRIVAFHWTLDNFEELRIFVTKNSE